MPVCVLCVVNASFDTYCYCWRWCLHANDTNTLVHTGATFNHFNTELTLWRQKHVHPSFARRAIEAAVVACSMSAVTFCIPLLWGKCTPKPVDMEDWTLQARAAVYISIHMYVCICVRLCMHVYVFV